MFSFLKVSGFIDEAIFARIDQKYHINRFERRLDFQMQIIITKMKQKFENKINNSLYTIQYCCKF